MFLYILQWLRQTESHLEELGTVIFYNIHIGTGHYYFVDILHIIQKCTNCVRVTSKAVFYVVLPGIRFFGGKGFNINAGYHFVMRF